MLSALLPARARLALLAWRKALRSLLLAATAAPRPLFSEGPAALPDDWAPQPSRPRAPASEVVVPRRSSGRSHAVRYARSAVTLEVDEAQTLLEAGLAAGLELASACRMGLCGTCRSRLLEGQVEMAEPNALSDAERERRYCLPCISRPRGPVTLDS